MTDIDIEITLHSEVSAQLKQEINILKEEILDFEENEPDYWNLPRLKDKLVALEASFDEQQCYHQSNMRNIRRNESVALGMDSNGCEEYDRECAKWA